MTTRNVIVIHISIVLLTMKKLKRSNLKKQWCFQGQNPGVITTKAASEVGEGWGEWRRMKTVKGLGKGDSRSAHAPSNTLRPAPGHTAGAGSAQFISVSGSALFPGLAKPTQSQLTEVVLTTSTITSMGQG